MQSFLNGTQNYQVLQGMQTNLYKCFLPVDWPMAGSHGVVAYQHPEGPYDDLKGRTLREELYSRLRAHFQFQNEFQLFTGTNDHGRLRFGLHIYSIPQEHVMFDHIANLFSPTTVDGCYAHAGDEAVGGSKAENGKWNIAGHRDRIVLVDDAALAVFAQLYDEQGTLPRRARLPSLHAGALQSVLEKLAAYPVCLADLGDDYFSTVMFDETGARRDGTIHRRSSDDNGFVTDISD